MAASNFRASNAVQDVIGGPGDSAAGPIQEKCIGSLLSSQSPPQQNPAFRHIWTNQAGMSVITVPSARYGFWAGLMSMASPRAWRLIRWLPPIVRGAKATASRTG